MNDDDRRDGHVPARDEVAFDDPEHAWVRDLLAEARVTEPMPDDVAGRLDETLRALQVRRSGDLAASEPSPLAPVVPPRRRLAPALVAAAAAVVVVGGGIAVTRTAHDGGDSNASRSTAADSAGGSAEKSTGQSPQDAITPAPSTATGSRPGSLGLAELGTATFARDAARAVHEFAVAQTLSGTAAASEDSADGDLHYSPGAPVTRSPALPPSATGDAARCPGPGPAGAVTVPALLDGHLVALVFLPPTARAQRVEAWSCNGSALLASASVPR